MSTVQTAKYVDEKFVPKQGVIFITSETYKNMHLVINFICVKTLQIPRKIEISSNKIYLIRNLFDLIQLIVLLQDNFVIFFRTNSCSRRLLNAYICYAHICIRTTEMLPIVEYYYTFYTRYSCFLPRWSSTTCFNEHSNAHHSKQTN